MRARDSGSASVSDENENHSLEEVDDDSRDSTFTPFNEVGVQLAEFDEEHPAADRATLTFHTAEAMLGAFLVSCWCTH